MSKHLHGQTQGKTHVGKGSGHNNEMPESSGKSLGQKLHLPTAMGGGDDDKSPSTGGVGGGAMGKLIHGNPSRTRRDSNSSTSDEDGQTRGKFRSKLHHAKIGMIHLKHKIGKLGNIVNTNHRHDEEHEKETDRKRTAIAESHRYHSFAEERLGNQVKFYVDGRDYFWALSMALEKAQNVIYIADWWISPELFLRRPPSYSHEDRFDKILQRRAEAGVKIYVIVYKEVEAALTCNSRHTKHALEGLCPEGSKGFGNIRIMRHPDHNVFENVGDMTFYWAHHEKFVMIDFEMAFVGGLDICFGRWDLKQHPLADVHPETITQEVWPGQDYNNNRIMDFQDVSDWKSNELSKTEYGRMPWHDCAIGFKGNAVLDVADHFVGRWNFIKRDKYKRDERYDWLNLTYRDDDLIGVQHPKHPVGGYTTHPVNDIDLRANSELGSVKLQLVRSSADWSHGILTEHSIQNAYSEIIRNAQHYVYFENQFFITATGEEQKPIQNTIGAAIVDAIARAHGEQRKFRIIVVIPSIPGFAGDLRTKAANGTRAIMDYQYKSMLRGEHSIAGRLAAQGIDASQYIFYFNLRSYDRLNTTAKIRKQEEKSGVSYQELQRENAEELMGEAGATGGRGFDDSSSESDIEDGDGQEERERLHDQKAKFEAQKETAIHERKGDMPDSQDTIAKNAMEGQKKVSQEPWDGSEDQERENYVTEQLYIHAKVLIADDKVAIVGSSNLNDRSQLGFHDSELSCVIEDQETIDSHMNGHQYKASKLVTQLRRQLWREHLGLMPPQELDATGDPNAQPPGMGVNELHESDSARIVDDPLNEDLWRTWCKQADDNTSIFRDLFHCVPDDNVKTFEQYDKFLPQEGIKSGHLFNPEQPIREVKEKLDHVKGHLVWFPLHFLEDAEMAERNLSLNEFTESVYT